MNSLIKIQKVITVFGLCFSVFFLSKSRIENLGKKVQSDQSIKVMTYNIHHGEGVDGAIDLNRIAQVINHSGADVVLLQEVDVGMNRSGAVDIPRELSKLTDLKYYVFGKNLEIDGGQYGNATLSKYPINKHRNVQFEKIGNEQRGILVTEIEINQSTFLILNTHLDNGKDDAERLVYIEKAAKEILPNYNVDAILFAGDFNDIPGSRVYKQAKEFFRDTWETVEKNEGFTFPSNNPTDRIDYFFYRGNIQPTNIKVIKTEASDHRPVVAEFIRIDN